MSGIDSYDTLNIDLNNIEESIKIKKTQTNSLESYPHYDSEIKTLFSYPLGIFNYGKNFTYQEIDTLRQVKYVENLYDYISDEKNILNYPSFFNIKKFINVCLIKYFNQVFVPKHNSELYVTESWLNKTIKGKFHHSHNHANSIVSGVFYFKTVKDDKITFYKDKPNSPYILVESESFNDYNSSLTNINVFEGQLLLFSSNMEHEVPQVNTDEERISLSFNTFIKGNINKTISSSLIL